MRSLFFATLFLVAAGSAGAQPIGVPRFRVPDEAVAAAARRIDAAALTVERTVWEKQMSKTPLPHRTAFDLPPLADDATFVRRASLDLHGRLPSPELVRAFLADTDPEKRARLVDRLLLDPASGARRFVRFADMFRLKDEVLGVSLRPFAAWLQDACAKAMPYDVMARAILTATGEVATNPATGFLLGDGGQMTVAAAEALRVFLDEDIACARCHNHPYNNWTQMHFYQLAACLGSTRVVRIGPQGQSLLWPPTSWSEPEVAPLAAGERLALVDMRGTQPLRLPPDYRYKDGKTGDPVRAVLFEWRNGELTMRRAPRKTAKEEQMRGEFANWLVGNQRFPLVAALRTWHELFGVPVQDGSSARQEYQDTTRSVHPMFRAGKSCEYTAGPGLPSWAGGGSLVGSFLDRSDEVVHRRLGETLAQEFMRVRQDLREFERILCRTAAYQRESIGSAMGARAQFIAPVTRRLRPETVWNNLVLVQSDRAPGSIPLSHELAQVPGESDPSRILGRGVRARADESYPLITHTLARFMMNGDPVKLASEGDSPLVRRLRATTPVDAAVDEAFLAVLARLPSQDEKIKAMEHGIANPATVWNDLVWSLLNTSEFLFQR